MPAPKPQSRRWVVTRQDAWKDLETLLDAADASTQALPPEKIRELALMYRSALNDLSRVRSNPEYHHLEPYLNNLVQRLHMRVYEKPPAKLGDILDFFLNRFPQTFRKNIGVIFLALLVFTVGSLLSMATVRMDPETETYFLPSHVVEQVRQGHLWVEGKDPAASESSFLMTNNIRVAFNAYVMGLFFGIGTLLILFYNGLFAFGGPLQICFNYGAGDKLLLFMLPHGVIELTTIFIAGGAGMIMGLALLFPGDIPRWDALRLRAKESLVLLAGCVPLLIIAGIIEGMVSLNPAVGAPFRIAIAVASGLLLFGYLGLSGRTQGS